MVELTLSGITKNYGDVSVIRGLELEIARGEFISLLGASGCGKSTTLSMIAGLEAPTTGRILFRDRVLASPAEGIFVEPEDRQFGVVFQSYALWPHMTVEQNLAFPLKIRKIAASEQRKRIAETLELVGLTGLEKRYPGQLSGGQQQRVGLARALVYRPQLLLLDEPLSNLDALLREQARVWLKEIQLKLGITTIYVTHDQTEALSLSDRIAVMKDGVIEQLGPPSDIYERPATPFVAAFVGSSNFLPATVVGARGEEIRIDLPGGQAATIISRQHFAGGEVVKLALRPERLKADRSDEHDNVLKVNLRRNVYVGERFSYECDLEGQTIQAFGERPLPEGPTELHFAPSSATVFMERTG